MKNPMLKLNLMSLEMLQKLAKYLHFEWTFFFLLYLKFFVNTCIWIPTKFSYDLLYSFHANRFAQLLMLMWRCTIMLKRDKSTLLYRTAQVFVSSFFPAIRNDNHCYFSSGKFLWESSVASIGHWSITVLLYPCLMFCLDYKKYFISFHRFLDL